LFKLSKTLCSELNLVMNKFWWGRQSQVRGIHWKSGDNLSLSKKKGGMGFRDLAMFNSALLAKQGWRLLQHLDSLVARIMQEKYFPSGDFMQAQWDTIPHMHGEA
jgi:hypothetical protein